MFFIKMQTFFSKVFCWLKNNWKIPFIVFWTGLVWFFARRDVESVKQVLKVRNESHKKQIDAINKRHVEKVLSIKKISEQYQKTIVELQKKFEEEQDALSEKQIEDVKEVVVKSKGDPEAIKRRIEREFGIKFKN